MFIIASMNTEFIHYTMIARCVSGGVCGALVTMDASQKVCVLMHYA